MPRIAGRLRGRVIVRVTHGYFVATLYCPDGRATRVTKSEAELGDVIVDLLTSWPHKKTRDLKQLELLGVSHVKTRRTTDDAGRYLEAGA